MKLKLSDVRRWDGQIARAPFLWAGVIHAIHRRVLDHIKQLSEAEAL